MPGVATVREPGLHPKRMTSDWRSSTAHVFAVIVYRSSRCCRGLTLFPWPPLRLVQTHLGSVCPAIDHELGRQVCLHVDAAAVIGVAGAVVARSLYIYGLHVSCNPRFVFPNNGNSGDVWKYLLVRVRGAPLFRY